MDELDVRQKSKMKMNISLKSLMSITAVMGFFAFGWILLIAFTFATESRPLTDFSVRNGEMISGAIVGASAIAGVGSAIMIWRKRNPGLIAKLAFTLASCCLAILAYIYLGSAI